MPPERFWNMGNSSLTGTFDPPHEHEKTTSVVEIENAMHTGSPTTKVEADINDMDVVMSDFNLNAGNETSGSSTPDSNKAVAGNSPRERNVIGLRPLKKVRFDER